MTIDRTRPAAAVVGENPTRIWGMTIGERTRRIAAAAGLPAAVDDSHPSLFVNAAFACDPPLLRWMAEQPDTCLMKDGVPALAHTTAREDAAAVRQAMASEVAPASARLTAVDHDGSFTLYNDQLRKREQPFLMALTPTTVPAIERRSYFAAYKGVTDILTKYLWPIWAFHLTRLAARTGMSPNMVTGIGAILCVLATWLFWEGDYWAGMAAGLIFMVLDTVDGKLARCTITSSKWGNVFDHGIDLIHPPFWWWAWGVGLSAWGLAFDRPTFAWVMTAIVGGYVLQRVIEGIFLRRYAMHIHVWEKADSDFRLITARRNPNMVLLFASVVAGRPDLGLIAVAGWTILSLVFHGVRLVQAMQRQARGVPIRSWLV